MPAPTRSLVTALAIALTLLAALASAHLTPAVSAAEGTFAVHLSSAGTDCQSRAQGQVLFRVNDEGHLTWRIFLTNIDKVTRVHLTTPSLVDGMRLFGGLGTPPWGIDPDHGLFAGGEMTDPWFVSVLLAALEEGTATVYVFTADCQGPELQGTLAGA